MLEHDGLATF